MSATEKNYARLVAILKEAAALAAARNALEWDMETIMPPKGAGQRAEVISCLAEAAHEKVVSPAYAECLESLKEEVAKGDLTGRQAAVVRRAWKAFERERRLPGEFVRELSNVCAAAHHVWVDARKNSDFRRFLPTLQKIVELKRQAAGLLGYEASPYDALLEDYEPGARVARLGPLFSDMRDFLVPFVRRLTDSGDAPDPAWSRIAAPRSAQERICAYAAQLIGFDMRAGRLDVSAHPFTIRFHPGDVRLTTRYDEADLADALMGAVHEAGHGIYEQNLPAEYFGTAVGESPSYGLHESQSRLWENLVGHGQPFWEFLLPLLRRDGLFDRDIGAEQFYRSINAVSPSLIRVSADEVTYNLHICLRFEIERDLIEGRVEPKDLPELWNRKTREYLGIEVPDDAQGVLQDVHWSAGLFGYFPSYTLGNLYSAQLFEAAKRDVPGLEQGFRWGLYRPLLEWLAEKVFVHGGELDAEEVVARATGAPPDARHFVEYVRQKYGAIYRL
jgi:carboxypeptidase Taq